MGEIQEILIDEMQEKFPLGGFHFESRSYQTSTLVNDKIYVIEGLDDEANSSLGIRIFDKLSSKWESPVVLGIKPSFCKGHSALLVNEDRILILKRESAPDDCIWFLEVDTPFVRDQRKIRETEVVAWSKGVIGDGPKPVVISGPSGVGKGTLIAKLMSEYPSMFGFSVSHTTRGPREKEKNGVHYHFTERSVMEKDIGGGKFLESASVHGNLYGTSIEAVEVVTDSGKRCILDIDVQGARSMRSSALEAIFIFVCPPSFEELEKRLRSRGTETEEQVQKRLRNALAELEEGRSSGLFDHILVNDDLNTCYEKLKGLLGLDGKTKTPTQQPSLADSHLSMGRCIYEMDQKILIQCGMPELGKSSLFTLDVSSLKGGAPGRTRDLNMYAIDQVTDGLNGHSK